MLLPFGLFAGASSWDYFTPFQTQSNAALKKLKEKVFKQGSYLGPGGLGYNGKKDKRQKPKSIVALQIFQADAGTHSIIAVPLNMKIFHET